MVEIELIFKRSDFEELYFSDGNDRIFFHPKVKGQTLMIFLLFALVIITFQYSSKTNNSWGLFIFISGLLIWSLVVWVKRLLAIFKWRNSINTYLDETSRYKRNKIVLSENTFAIIQDNTETIERWTEFKQVELSENYVCLIGNQTYLIPKKSISENEFDLLTKEVRERIQISDNPIS